MINKKEKVRALSIISIFMILAIICTGSLTSGFHLVDDHCLYDISDMLKKDTFINVLVRNIRSDLGMRFRPLYMSELVVGTAIMDTHMTLWNFYKLIEGIFTAFFIYLFSRRIRMNVYWSTLFTIVVMCGSQFICWCRAGNQENTGLLLCSLALLYLAKSTELNSKKIHRIIFVIFALLMSLMKESFVLFIPSLYLFEICMYEEDSDYTTKSFWVKCFAPIKKTPISWILLLVTCLGELLTIVLFVGTNKIGYAGFSANTPIEEYFTGIIRSVKADLKYGILLLLFSVLLIAYGSYKNKINYFGKYSFRIFLSIYIFLSQLVLHAKSGMDTRYLIPWVFCVAVMCIWTMSSIEGDISDDLWFHDYKLVLVIYTIIVVIISLSSPYKWANEAPTGKNRFLTEAVYYSHPGDDVGVFGVEGEHLDSVCVWLNHRDVNVIDVSTEREIIEDIPDTLIVMGDANIIDITVIPNWKNKYQYVWVRDDYSIWRRIDE